METCKPKIYVASLAHYNHGEPVGSWFDCSDDLSCNVQQYICGGDKSPQNQSGRGIQ